MNEKKKAMIDIALLICGMLMVMSSFFIGRYTVLPDGGIKSVSIYAEDAADEDIRKAAESYLEAAAYSRDGLIAAMHEYEHFDAASAAKVVDAMNIDWQEQAERELNAYLQSSGCSERQVREYMERDLFTEDEIDAALKAVSPDWQEQAEKCAEILLSSGISKGNLYAALISRGFTRRQVISAL